MARQKLSAALLVLIMASGCSTTGEYVEPNRSLDSVNQPVVQRTDFVLDLAGGAGSLDVAERARLSAWFDSLNLGYGDRVWVDEPYPSGNRADVASVAAEYGLLLSEGAPITAGAVAPGSVRVIVSRSTASVPGCPFWDGDTSEGETSPNYGCATNSNLAAMIADPNDLILGQAGSVSDTSTAAKAIKVYRETAPTGAGGLKEVTTTGGN